MTPVFSRQFLLWLGNVCLLVLWATLNIHWSLGSTAIKLTTVGFSAILFCWVCHFVFNLHIPLAYTIAHIYIYYIVYKSNTQRFNQGHFFCQHYMVYSMSNTTLSGCLITPFSPFHPKIPSRILPLVEAISACEKAEKWQHALALLADLASRPWDRCNPGSDREDWIAVTKVTPRILKNAM